MTEDAKNLTIEFAPGCFDDFEGTQEELNHVVAEIKNMFVNGDFMARSQPLDMERLAQEEPEVYARLLDQLDELADAAERRLQ